MARPVGATWTLTTPPGAGAVAIIQVQGDIDGALAACAMKPLAIGGVSLRDMMGIDRGLVARWTEDMCQLMPHAGVAVVRGVCSALEARGIHEVAAQDPTVLYPEARSAIDARALAALSRAASPLAVDLLLAQHDLWLTPGAASDPLRDRVLNRLIDAPLLVALGASNIGKSTLVNSLAGRSVSVVADEPGTTRDHVGVMLDMGGLVVRYVDTPGVRDGAGDLEKEALTAALEVAAKADLLLLCGDAGAQPPKVTEALADRPCVRVALRSDLGRAAFNSDVTISSKTQSGLKDLVTLVRETLVPSQALASTQPWRFWT